MIPPLTGAFSPAGFPATGFKVARLPEIRFGAGVIDQLGAAIAAHGRRALLVTGRRSFQAGPHWPRLTAELDARGVAWEQLSVEGEPSPELVDTAVARFRGAGIAVVAAMGGGSVLDAAKAIAGLLPQGNSVMDHLEGVGANRPYAGPALPWIAVPTTAGTGSEATKNAVLSRQGADGFKKSFRDDQLVARLALVDPALLASCPREQLAANGMDAFTQLLESYVSLGASPFTDALALQGLAAFRDGFWPAYDAAAEHAPAGAHTGNDAAHSTEPGAGGQVYPGTARRADDSAHKGAEDGAAATAAGYAGLAFASLCSGITLAQAGLGSVHGLASPLGAFFPIPHGVVCGTLVAAATAANIRALEARDPQGPGLQRYTAAARLLCPDAADADARSARDALVERLAHWTERLELPRLSAYGMTAADIPRVVANSRGSSMKTNPLVLTDEDIAAVLHERL